MRTRSHLVGKFYIQRTHVYLYGYISLWDPINLGILYTTYILYIRYPYAVVIGKSLVQHIFDISAFGFYVSHIIIIYYSAC